MIESDLVGRECRRREPERYGAFNGAKDRRCIAISELAEPRNRSTDNLLDTQCDSPDAKTARQSEPA
jgi:hypothetical protein